MSRQQPSEIFEEYAKIAQAKGLIKNAQKAKESKELKEYKEAVYPRVGSDTISIIESLYNIKTETPKGMEYEKNIMEDAHPNQVIIAPSYDKLNGLIENHIERQRIIINIMQKPVNGHSIQKKYAAELMNELVKTATDLDNRELNQLRELADTCTVQLHEITKKKVKNAFGPLAIAAVAAGVLGAVYLFNHMGDPDKGLVGNLKRAIDAIDSLIGEDWFHKTFYATLRPEFLINLKKLRTDLGTLSRAAADFNSLELQMRQVKTLQELVATSHTSGQEIVVKAEEFRHLLQNIGPEIIQAITLFSREDIKNLAIKDESWFSNLTSKIEPLLHGGWGLFHDRFDDIKEALLPLQDSIKSTIMEINNIDNLKETREKQVTDALTHAQAQAPKKTIETPELGPSTPQKSLTMEDLESQMKEIGLSQ